MARETTLAIFAIAVALGLVGALVIETVILPQQQAEAAKSITGQCASSIKNSSSSFCHRL